MVSLKGGISVSRRLALGIGTNALDKLWIIAVQLISIPILITAWGVTNYGLWLMLITVPSYIALSDLGFGMAASSDMTKKIALGDRAGAIRTFQSIWLLVSLLSVCVIIVGVVVWCLARQFPASGLEKYDRASSTAFLLVIYAILSLQMSLIFSWYQSTQRYALGTFVTSLTIPAEGAALVITVWLGAGIYGGAAAWLGVRATILFVQLLVIKRYEPWIEFGWKHSTIYEIRRLANPAFAALSLPISTALTMQGAIIIVGLAISPGAAAMFGITRTITRLPLQATGALSRAAMPEISVAYARGDRTSMEKLIAANLLSVVLCSVPGAIVILLFGTEIVNLISRGHVAVPFSLFIIMALAMVAQTLWNTLGSFLFALNLQHLFTHIYALIAIASILVCYLVARHFGLVSMAVLLLGVDSAMIVVTLRAWAIATGESWQRMFRRTWEISLDFGKNLASYFSVG